MWPEVIEAMTYAMKHRGRMKDLHNAGGKTDCIIIYSSGTISKSLWCMMRLNIMLNSPQVCQR